MVNVKSRVEEAVKKLEEAIDDLADETSDSMLGDMLKEEVDRVLENEERELKTYRLKVANESWKYWRG